MTIRKIHGVTVDADTVDGNDSAALLLPSAFAKLETRDLSAGAGDVAYTGYGFTPRGLIMGWRNAADEVGSLGVAGSDGAGVCVYYDYENSKMLTSDFLFHYQSTSSKYTQAIVKTYDADGFTLTWTKTGTPARTISMIVFAVK